MSDLLLGIDGGGSRTRAVVTDRAGTVLGHGLAASSNYQSVGFTAATAALRQAIDQALTAAAGDGVARDHLLPFAAACFGLAGVDRPHDRAVIGEWIEAAGITRRFTVVNDAELVLAAGTPQGWGIALIAGTGSICYGKARDGRSARAGGWGYLLGDEGSGYDLSVRALRLATQTADGRADAVRLLQAILAHWRLQEPEQLIGYVYQADRTRADIATIASVVIKLSEAGDPHAVDLVTRAGKELGRLITVVVQRLGLFFDSPPVALGGGLLLTSPRLQELAVRHAAVSLGPVAVVEDSVHGAITLARRLLRDA